MGKYPKGKAIIQHYWYNRNARHLARPAVKTARWVLRVWTEKGCHHPFLDICRSVAPRCNENVKIVPTNPRCDSNVSPHIDECHLNVDVLCIALHFLCSIIYVLCWCIMHGFALALLFFIPWRKFFIIFLGKKGIKFLFAFKTLYFTIMNNRVRQICCIRKSANISRVIKGG